jgi:hypothetical protein
LVLSFFLYRILHAKLNFTSLTKDSSVSTAVSARLARTHTLVCEMIADEQLLKVTPIFLEEMISHKEQRKELVKIVFAL